MTQTAENNPGILQLGDKWYVTVAARIRQFWDSEEYKGWSINTHVTRLASSVEVRATIIDAEGRTRSTGTAEKPWKDGVGSARQGVERAETAAVGRALVNLGLLADHGVASWEEVADSVITERDEAVKQLDRLKEHTRAISDNLKTVYTIHRAYLADRWDVVAEQYYGLPEADQIALFGVAPSKGGIWSTAERKEFKEGEKMREARKAYFAAQQEDEDDE